jgi:hypothetical protein
MFHLNPKVASAFRPFTLSLKQLPGKQTICLLDTKIHTLVN